MVDEDERGQVERGVEDSSASLLLLLLLLLLLVWFGFCGVGFGRSSVSGRPGDFRIRRWEEGGMPVMGRSLVFSVDRDQDGEMRRSPEAEGEVM